VSIRVYSWLIFFSAWLRRSASPRRARRESLLCKTNPISKQKLALRSPIVSGEAGTERRKTEDRRQLVRRSPPTQSPSDGSLWRAELVRRAGLGEDGKTAKSVQNLHLNGVMGLAIPVGSHPLVDYVLAAFFTLLIPVYLFRKAEGPSPLRRYGKALLMNVRGNLLVAIVLAVAAIYEAIEVILSMM